MRIILLTIAFALFLGLLYSFRNDIKKISLLVLGVALQIFGAYLIFQDGIKADEQGTGGDIFGNPIALLAIGTGLIIMVIIGLSFLKKAKIANFHNR